MKKLKLTRKRKEWADKRSEAPVFKGESLQHNAALSVKYAGALSSLTAQMTAQVKRDIIKLFRTDAAASHFGQDATIASQSRMMIAALNNKFTALFAKKAKPLAEGMVKKADKASTPALHSSLQKLTGGMSLKTSVTNSNLTEIYKATVAENVGLIKSIASEYLQKVEGAVMRSITTGNGLQDLIPALEQYEGQTHRRAKNIALDQTRKAYNSINRGRMEAIGVKKFMWHHSGGGAHPREDHVEMDGNIYSFDDLPVIDQRTGERGIPGQAPNCFPGDSQVEFPNGINKLFRRWYSGELISIITDNGVILEATRNHPILTRKGWVPIQFINEGDYLVKGSDETVDVRKTDIDNLESRFDNVFNSSVSLLIKGRATTAGTALQFHGDGTDEEVEIVFTNGHLPCEADSAFCEQLIKFIFAFSNIDSTGIYHFGDGTRNEFLLRSVGVPQSFIGGLCSLLAMLKSGGLSGHDISLRLPAYLHSRFNEPDADYVPRYAEIFSKLKLALPGNISGYNDLIMEILSACRLAFGKSHDESTGSEKLGEVVRVDVEQFGNLVKSSSTIKQFDRVNKKSIREFAGFVHNAETPVGWYIVNGFIVHNCRCTMSPVFSFEDK